MKQLETLEKKILAIVERNKKLREENEVLTKEKQSLEQAKSKLESSLLKETNSSASLVKERDSIKGSVESLLKNLDKLEADLKG